jgi:hypothetical protein
MCGRATAVETVACTIGPRLMATRLNAGILARATNQAQPDQLRA